MKELTDYIFEHTARGECQCGKCVDKGPDRAAPAHSVDLHFFWVSAQNDPTADELWALLAQVPEVINQLRFGADYIWLGATLGSQEAALMLLGLGKLVGLWEVITPELCGKTGEDAARLAGTGMVMCLGIGPWEKTHGKA
jgi:hypothetical protein